MKSAAFLLPLPLLAMLGCGGAGAVLSNTPPTVRGVVAKVWKNGTLFQTLGDGTAGAAANGLAFSGTDLLAAGWRSTSAAKAASSWRNGTPQPALTDGATDAEAMAVRPSGTDVYQVGYATVP